MLLSHCWPLAWAQATNGPCQDVIEWAQVNIWLLELELHDCTCAIWRHRWWCFLISGWLEGHAWHRNRMPLAQNRHADLSDPRNRNHKSLAIGNPNFEAASLSSRNRNKMTVSQSQKSHCANKIAAIRNHNLVVATYVSRPMWRFWNTKKSHTKLADPESKELASEGVFGVAVIFLSCDCSR